MGPFPFIIATPVLDEMRRAAQAAQQQAMQREDLHRQMANAQPYDVIPLRNASDLADIVYDDAIAFRRKRKPRPRYRLVNTAFAFRDFIGERIAAWLIWREVDRLERCMN